MKRLSIGYADLQRTDFSFLDALADRPTTLNSTYTDLPPGLTFWARLPGRIAFASFETLGATDLDVVDLAANIRGTSSRFGGYAPSQTNAREYLLARGQVVSHTDVEGRWAQRNATAWYVSDVRGSTIALMGRHGNTEASYKYDAYGVVYGRGAAERHIEAIPGRLNAFKRGTDYLYTGKRQDAATGLYDYGFRDYAPRVARFTSVDPIKDGRNWYAYVGADPVNLVDPLGLRTVDDGEAAEQELRRLEKRYGTYAQDPYFGEAQIRSRETPRNALGAILHFATGQSARQDYEIYDYGLDMPRARRAATLTLSRGTYRPEDDYVDPLGDATALADYEGAPSSIRVGTLMTLTQTESTISGRPVKSTTNEVDMTTKSATEAKASAIALAFDTVASLLSGMDAAERLANVTILSTRVNGKQYMTMVAPVTRGIDAEGIIRVGEPRPLTREEVLTFYDDFVQGVESGKIQPVLSGRDRSP